MMRLRRFIVWLLYRRHRTPEPAQPPIEIAQSKHERQEVQRDLERLRAELNLRQRSRGR